MTTSKGVEPPRIPGSIGIKYDKEGNLTTGSLWTRWTVPMAQATVQTIAGSGRSVTVVISSPTGETRQIRVKGMLSDHTAAWAVAFNAWQQALRGA